MMQTNGLILCLAYILGLLSTAIPWGGLGVLLLGVVGALLFSRRYSATPPGKTTTQPWLMPKRQVWLIAGVIGLLAGFYLQMRVPQPRSNDISKLIPKESSQEQLFTVRGKVASTPRLTRSHRGQFWLEATQLDEIKGDADKIGVSKGVTGKLYVTVPLLQSTGLHPNQAIAVTGILYQPKAAMNPGAFDFQKFLQREGAFAGLSGRHVEMLDEHQKNQWGWWELRRRIVRSQVSWLGIPEGPVISALVLGSRAIDLSYAIKDEFVRVGLAHVLGSAGFKTALILGVVLTCTRSFSRSTQFTLGSTALIVYACLTGFYPSVLRAVILGFGALVALVLNRKLRKLRALPLVATLLLLFNPLWIWDLGFQLSFLATFGLLVTAQPLIKRLDWLPPAFASTIAISLAASIWTLPLVLHYFSTLPVYSLLLNILVTPLVSFMTIVGIISAVVALIWPAGGSAIAWSLYYPTHWLLSIVDFGVHLPGNSIAIGSMAIWQVLLIYAIYILTWLVPLWQSRWWLSGLIAASLAFIPMWYAQSTFRITVLAAGQDQILVIQDRGKTTLINSGDENTARFAILPFLQQQGVNQIDTAIATNSQIDTNSGWLELLERLPIKVFYDYYHSANGVVTTQAIQRVMQQNQGNYQILPLGQTINTGSAVMQLINAEPPILQFQIQGKNWLLLGDIKSNEQKQMLKNGTLPHPQVLWWSGEVLSPELIEALKPEVAIATSPTADPETLSKLRELNTQLFWTGRDGAIQWTPEGKFETIIDSTENKASVL